MSIAARLNRRISQLAVGRHLPYRAVRVRLTLLYGGLFLLSGAALMAIAYALLVNAGFVFTLQNGASSQPPTGPPSVGSPAGLPGPGSVTHPSSQTMAHWRAVAQCMRQHGVPEFPDPTTSVPSNLRHSGEASDRDRAIPAIQAPSELPRIGEVSDRDGAILVFPATIDMQSPTFIQAASACEFMADTGEPTVEDNLRRTRIRQQLLIQSGIALAGMSLLSLGLGWIMAGRVLQPLEDSHHAQRQFVANASHELRAPLTRLRALSEVALASSGANVSSLRRAHERVLVSEQHLEQLIDGLLALTRGQAGIDRHEHLDLAALTAPAMLARQSELAGLDLDVHATLDPAPTAGDPRLLERVIANLIDNAIRHNIPDGRLEITTGTHDRHAFVSVTNTGATVPPEQIERLLQPFQRLGGARTRHDNGHGLGLSIVQAIANAHGAELSARARPDGGLTIVVSFPPVTGAGAAATFAAAWTRRLRQRISLRD